MNVIGLHRLLRDYESNMGKNPKIEEHYIWASDYDFMLYDKEDARKAESLVAPFDKKIKRDVRDLLCEFQEKGLDFVSGTYKGHDKEYYEALRVKYNEEIADETDSLRKLKLIEKYGNELYEASYCFVLLELVNIISEGCIF